MTTVFICGEPDDAALEKLIREKLALSYRVTYVKNGEVWQEGAGYEVVCAELSCCKKISAEHSVLLLKKDALCKAKLSKNTFVVACAENAEQIGCLRNSRATVLTCGFSQSDTFSYSSIAEETVTVSLNREITALSGKKIQPLEIPLQIPDGADVYSVLAFTALRLLLDDFNSEIGNLY